MWCHHVGTTFVAELIVKFIFVVRNIACQAVRTFTTMIWLVAGQLEFDPPHDIAKSQKIVSPGCLNFSDYFHKCFLKSTQGDPKMFIRVGRRAEPGLP